MLYCGWVSRKLVGCTKDGVIYWVGQLDVFVQLSFALFGPHWNTQTERRLTSNYNLVIIINMRITCVNPPNFLSYLTHSSSTQRFWQNLLYMLNLYSSGGLVNPTRSPFSTPSGGDPSQQAQPGSITPRRAVKCLLCICRRVVGGLGLSDGHQHMFEYRVRVPNTNTTKQFHHPGRNIGNNKAY